MEVAIPLVALAGLYIASNQKKENFKSELPNVDVPDVNYGAVDRVVNSETDISSQLATTNKYDSPGVYTDKYFNPNYSKPTTDKSSSEYYSLSGKKVDSSYFQHNNMVPFFGSHVRNQHVDNNINESILDNYQGSGSQFISKTERAPLFSPQDNYQWAHGAPNMSDFYQSRQVPAMKMSNVKPFADEKVGPGLGLGYGTEGSGGFNSGLISRDLHLPKTANELRVANKPKAGENVMLGYEGAPISLVTRQGQIGVVEKNRVDTSFEFGQDRWFTTTGVEKGVTLNPILVDRHVNRPETDTDYVGVAGNSNVGVLVDGEYMPSKHIDLGSVPLAAANARGRQGAKEGDYGLNSNVVYPNNRTENKQDNYFGLVGGAIGAVVAPLLDILKPSRKENTIGSLRPYQNPGTTIPQSYIFNPADRMGPTIRETTEQSKNHLFVNSGQNSDGYKVTGVQPSHTMRQYTSDYFYGGNASAGEGGRQARTYDAEYNQRNNENKSSTLVGYTPAGKTDTFNNNVNMTMKPRENVMENKRPVMTNLPYQSPSAENMGKLQGLNALPSNIQLDRTNPNILDQLKGNPFALSNLGGL
jgi:hypothetical protein